MEDALQTMVLISDGDSEHVAHVSRKAGIFENIFPICGCKCLGQIKWSNSLFMCALISEQPTNKSTMMADEDVV